MLFPQRKQASVFILKIRRQQPFLKQKICTLTQENEIRIFIFIDVKLGNKQVKT